MEFIITLITSAVFLAVVIGLYVVYDQFFGYTAWKRKRNDKDFKTGSEWGYKKVDGHYVHGDEPLVCPLSGTKFYRWEWSDFKDAQDWEYSHPPWPLSEHMSDEDGRMMRLVCIPCFENRQDEIQTRNTEVHERGVAEWEALSLSEKQAKYAEGPMDSGPAVRLSDEGLYENYDSEKGTWVRIPGSRNELTGRSD